MWLNLIQGFLNFNSFLARDNLSLQLITFANSLDPDLDGHSPTEHLL